MAKFILDVNAHVTIFEELRCEVEAETKAEAIRKAREKFEIMISEKYPWADYDETYVEEVE